MESTSYHRSLDCSHLDFVRALNTKTDPVRAIRERLPTNIVQMGALESSRLCERWVLPGTAASSSHSVFLVLGNTRVAAVFCV